MAEPTLFICYNHTDQKYREQFSKFLQTSRLQGMEIFSDVAIQPGDEWQNVILDKLEKATAALILVSQDFMISPFIQQVELREILMGYIHRGLRLFLVPVRATNYQGTYLERFEWARPPDKPLSLLTDPEQEAAMVDICLKIGRQLAKDNPDAPSPERTIECLKSVPKLDLPSMYELQAPIGEGEFARCFKAHDQLLDRTVIIKVLNTELSRDSPAYDKYVRSASRLTHRNILGLLFSQVNKLPHFIVTLAVGDETLETRRQRARPSIDEAVRCTIDLAATLAYAHRQNCVHGRLRPCEVRFDHEGEHVLSGFRTIEACAATRSAANRKVSLEEFVYSSPEQRECGAIDPKTDQYQLGLLAYEMIAGAPHVHITESGWAAVLSAQTAQALLHPRPLKDFVEECDERVSDVVMRMLSVDPAARWDSLDTVVKELQAALSRAPGIDEAKASYRRCAQTDRFYETLYNKLFDVMPEIRGMFAGRSMEQQYQVLRDSLWLLLSYAENTDRNEPTILSAIARTHARFEPSQFDTFRDAVLEAVALHDPIGATAVYGWREAMAPGIDYLKSKAGKAAYTST